MIHTNPQPSSHEHKRASQPHIEAIGNRDTTIDTAVRLVLAAVPAPETVAFVTAPVQEEASATAEAVKNSVPFAPPMPVDIENPMVADARRAVEQARNN